MRSRHELTKSILSRYLEAGKAGKSRVLDEYCANTGHNRKYAISKLRAYQLTDNLNHKVPGRHRRRREKIYGLVRALKAHKEIVLGREIEGKLLV